MQRLQGKLERLKDPPLGAPLVSPPGAHIRGSGRQSGRSVSTSRETAPAVAVAAAAARVLEFQHADAKDDPLDSVEIALWDLRRAMAKLPFALSAAGGSLGSDRFEDSLMLGRAPNSELFGAAASNTVSSRLPKVEAELVEAMQTLQRTFGPSSRSVARQIFWERVEDVSDVSDVGAGGEAKLHRASLVAEDAAERPNSLPHGIRCALTSLTVGSNSPPTVRPEQVFPSASLQWSPSAVSSSPSSASSRPAASLGSSISAFAPPAPGAAQVLAATREQACAELRALADAAGYAASTCPACVPLAEALRTAVARELAALRSKQVTTSTALERAAGVRVVVAEGLHILMEALGRRPGDNDTSTPRMDNDKVAVEAQQPLGAGPCNHEDFDMSDTTAASLPSCSMLQQSSFQESPKEVTPRPAHAEVFGVVAANIRRAVDEIREARSTRQYCAGASVVGGTSLGSSEHLCPE